MKKNSKIILMGRTKKFNQTSIMNAIKKYNIINYSIINKISINNMVNKLNINSMKNQISDIKKNSFFFFNVKEVLSAKMEKTKDNFSILLEIAKLKIKITGFEKLNNLLSASFVQKSLPCLNLNLNTNKDSKKLEELEQTDFAKKSLKFAGSCHNFLRPEKIIFKLIDHKMPKIPKRYFDGKLRFIQLAAAFFAIFLTEKLLSKTTNENPLKIRKDNKYYKPIDIDFKPITNNRIIFETAEQKLVKWLKRLRNLILFLLFLLFLELFSHLVKRFGYADLSFSEFIQYYLQLASDKQIDYLKGLLSIVGLEDSLYTLKTTVYSHTNMLASMDLRIKNLIERFNKLLDTIQEIKNQLKGQVKSEVMKDVENAITNQSKEISNNIKKRFEKIKKELFDELLEKLMKELEAKKANSFTNSFKIDEKKISKILNRKRRAKNTNNTTNI